MAAVDLSGLDRAGATEALQAAFAYDQGDLVLRAPGGDITIPYRAFGRHADVDALVDAALQSGRGGDLATRLVAELGQALHGVSLRPQVVLDQQALAAAVTAALAPLRTSPVDATIAASADGFVTTPAEPGRAVDPGPVIAAALAAVAAPDAPSEVVVPTIPAAVPAAVDDTAVRTAAARADLVVGDLTIAFGKHTWKLKASTVRSWIVFTTAPDGTVQPGVNVTKIPPWLKGIAKTVRKPATSAVFLRANTGQIVGVAASADGAQLDAGATAQRIADGLMARIATGVAAPVKVALAPVPPKLTTEQATLKAPVMSLLGTWTTWFPISDHNYYGANIWIPAQIINGTVLAPGQTFDWWNAIGDVTPARGFGPGGVIKGNHTDPTGALGGGMCSSSTTLFNAALRAGLQMGARAEPPLLHQPLPARSRRHGLEDRQRRAGHVVHQRHGPPDPHPGDQDDRQRRPRLRDVPALGHAGRSDRVALGADRSRNVVQATTNTEYVTTLPHGVSQQTEYPSNQMDVAVTRVVRDTSGRVIHAEVWRSHYVLWNGMIQIGQ